MDTWDIVTFDETGDVEVVPSKWIMKHENVCLWPTLSKNRLEKAIKQCIQPDEKSWTRFPMKIISKSSYKKFNVATAQATKACITSDLSEEVSEADGLPCKRIPKKNKYFSDADVRTSSEEEQEDNLSNFPNPPKCNVNADVGDCGVKVLKVVSLPNFPGDCSGKSILLYICLLS